MRYQVRATVATVCSGALLLAEVGLLVGEEAKVHWAYEKTFRDFYRDVKFYPERILTFAGDGDRMVLAGGMSSWQDLALYLITRFLGPEHAVQVSKFYVISDHTEGQLPYAALSRQIQSDDQVIGKCQIWLCDNYATCNAVARMQELSAPQAVPFHVDFGPLSGAPRPNTLKRSEPRKQNSYSKRRCRQPRMLRQKSDTGTKERFDEYFVNALECRPAPIESGFIAPVSICCIEYVTTADC